MKVDVKQFQEYLASLDIESEVASATELSPVEQLEVHIGNDEEGRPRAIVVMIDKGIESELEEEDAVHIVKYLGIMPLEIKKELVPDVARMVSYVNHVSDIPGFLVSEPLSSVYFLYGLACPGGVVEPRQFVSTLGIIGSLIDLYQPFIEKVSRGELSIDKVLSGEIEME